jgi:hypothetical protein
MGLLTAHVLLAAACTAQQHPVELGVLGQEVIHIIADTVAKRMTVSTGSTQKQ